MHCGSDVQNSNQSSGKRKDLCSFLGVSDEGPGSPSKQVAQAVAMQNLQLLNLHNSMAKGPVNGPFIPAVSNNDTNSLNRKNIDKYLGIQVTIIIPVRRVKIQLLQGIRHFYKKEWASSTLMELRFVQKTIKPLKISTLTLTESLTSTLSAMLLHMSFDKPISNLNTSKG